MRFVVESWSTEYGSPVETAGDEEDRQNWKTDVSVEVPAEQWRPLDAAGPPAACVVFIDGVQQIDARVWTSEDGISRMGLCVSLAAGSVRCDGVAVVEKVELRRVVFGPPSLGAIDCGGGIVYQGAPMVEASPVDLETALRRRREDLEVEVAHSVAPSELMIVDGHVRQRETIAGAVGYLKSHQAQYLAPEQARIVGRLLPGQRTPLFLLETPWSRYSWYLRLPGGQGHDWGGVVRCETSPALAITAVKELADRTAATLGGFASQQYKDTRAPQNLSPVAALERDMRRRLGDRQLLLRALQRASHDA